MNKELLIPFDAPLNKKDTEAQTYGCRQNNPNICATILYLEFVPSSVTTTYAKNLPVPGRNNMRS